MRMFEMKIVRLCFVLISLVGIVENDKPTQAEVITLVRFWSKKIGNELKSLSETMSRKEKFVESFNVLRNHTHEVNGTSLSEEIAAGIRLHMDRRSEAVKRIAQYAEFLSFYRPDDPLFPNSSFHYFNADNFTTTDPNPEVKADLKKYMRESECAWWCNQQELAPLPNNTIFDKSVVDSLFQDKGGSQDTDRGECDCELNLPTRDETSNFYNNFSLIYDPHYESEVNLNFSVVKVATQVHDRDQRVLEGVRWSEPLDLIFKENLERDPTLTWQYFASPHGFMRHYPAIKWSTEQYDQTYDMRTRSWYTEAMTSPKDVFILVDRSGSMHGVKRALSAQIVNNILDTLNDNDFVNIYVFTNTTEPLVPCFENALMQANEENLRLLREFLPTYNLEFAADISLGYRVAFEILKRYNKSKLSSRCNQAIMLISEGLDYDYQPELLRELNADQNIRIFTYLLGAKLSDKWVMEDIACQNMGYFVNVSMMQEIRDKMVNYMTVMSRPINYASNDKQNEIWSYLYADLADRRICNWVWKKWEGNRQREVFLDHAKRVYERMKTSILTSSNINLLTDSHDYQIYETPRKNYYMTTVSYPVYGRRNNEPELIGVAAVDVPITLLESLIPHHLLGVNGYAFVVTNNGYVLMHPDHRKAFQKDLILKPTFNRVDLLEVEILDDKSEPRLFDKSIVKLREKVVYKGKGHASLKVKFALYDLKRIMLTTRHYFYSDIGPFGFAIVLPDNYGTIKINNSVVTAKTYLKDYNWKVHPKWIYCINCGDGTPEDKIRKCLNNTHRCRRKPLLNTLLTDAKVTNWFEEPISGEKHFINKYYVSKLFVATRSGLTRWRTFYKNEDDDVTNDFELVHPNSIDEDWYRRAVEEYYKNENMFIYSVPFEISGYENNTMITSTNAIFVSNGKTKTPVATIGIQFNHRTMYDLYNNITTKCTNGGPCNITCESTYLSCYILDNNAYVVLSDDIEHTGRFIGDLRPDIMHHLVKNKVYRSTRMFDYQGICKKEPREMKPKKTCKSSAYKFRLFFENLLKISQWALSTVMLFLDSVVAGPQYQSDKNETIAYEKLEIKKTLPTPCDTEMWLFTLNNNFSSSPPMNSKQSKFDCLWPYVVHKIPDSNLIFMAINGICKVETVNIYQSPTPKEIIYNETLPCYIANKNNYTRHIYTKCYSKDKRETNLNLDRRNCGHTWKGDY